MYIGIDCQNKWKYFIGQKWKPELSRDTILLKVQIKQLHTNIVAVKCYHFMYLKHH